ncbi:PREDICTED: uncharacterized protein LOC104799096 isoform X2 [Tarenaya hassleriana]|uniref:uncharacterized protein LOC104799096 isoform X2 n=1 Tax=Tarenaya hassleriana TaxID=28532 RepID=UPI00053CA89A|nr:PREDICTED: uncharacterized protein LOC104799096 isoform X2 [Tarenaya hassleriana]
MEKYLAPSESLPGNPIPKFRFWKRSSIELNGRFDPDYRHELYCLLAHSYSEIGVFPHLYHVNEEPCQTHISEVQNHARFWGGVAGLEFDRQGIYLVSVTRSRCLTVHDFESLYCQTKVYPGSAEDENKHVVHFSMPLNQEFDVVRWNPGNQNEVACTSIKRSKVLIFDISYISPEPVEELHTRAKLSVVGRKIPRGLCDLAITKDDNTRVISPDTLGLVNVWDRRVGGLPRIELSTVGYDTINSVQINVENQTIFGAGKEGIIHIWDLRGGRTSTAFQAHKEVHLFPLASIHLATELQKIRSLREQSQIVPKEIHSIDLNPSCPSQLAFHLNDGWSGVLDIYRSKVTHVHCPPPAWLDGSNTPTDTILRKPSWLPTSSMYVVGSMVEKGIHILDFHPNSSSPCHVDYDEEDFQRKEKTRQQYKRINRFLPLSESVTVCAAHPLNSMIVAGTKRSSLLLVAQKHGLSRSES